MTKEQNKDLIRFRKGIYNGLGNNFRRVKKGLLIRKEATEDGTAIDSEGIGVKGTDAVQLSELTEA